MEEVGGDEYNNVGIIGIKKNVAESIKQHAGTSIDFVKIEKFYE